MPSKSKAQYKLMEIASYNTDFAESRGIKQDAAREWHNEDRKKRKEEPEWYAKLPEKAEPETKKEKRKKPKPKKEKKPKGKPSAESSYVSPTTLGWASTESIKEDYDTDDYSEGPESTLSHQGKTFLVDELIKKSRDLDVVDFDITKLQWEVKEDPVDPKEDRVEQADLAVPVLVTEYAPGKWVTMDGFHRLTKAFHKGDKTIKARIVSDKIVRTLASI